MLTTSTCKTSMPRTCTRYDVDAIRASEYPLLIDGEQGRERGTRHVHADTLMSTLMSTLAHADTH